MRIRSIKPEFWSSLDIKALGPARALTFIGLWNYADDEGKGSDEPQLIAAALYPFGAISPDEVVEHIAAMERVGVLERYEVAGRRYFRVTGWHRHQAISRPRPSTLPDPDGSIQVRVPDTSGQEGKGREQGREGKGYIPEFEAFWSVYPLHKGKGAASKAFDRALDRASAEEITAGAQRYADDPNRKLDFTKYAEGWLNADRWLDEVAPTEIDRALTMLRNRKGTA